MNSRKRDASETEIETSFEIFENPRVDFQLFNRRLLLVFTEKNLENPIKPSNVHESQFNKNSYNDNQV